MEYKSVITVSAFAVIFLSALFLFIRNYPSDRWFSGVFIVAGGVMAWCSQTMTTMTTTTTSTSTMDTDKK